MFFSNTIVHFAQGTFYDWTLTCMNPVLSLLMYLSLMQTQMHTLKLTLSETTVLLNSQWQTLLNDVLSLFFLSNIKPTSLRRTSYSTPAHPHAMLNYKKKRQSVQCKNFIACCGWTELLQTSGGVEMRRAEDRWCLALNVSSQRSAQLWRNPETITDTHLEIHTHMQTHIHIVCL